ncbi:hypothetical protein LLE49_03185 [Alicyclobacillus tolerans]|uniref:hypothetical protein n=1 Tax=Alicyclobacillus tolerans TaxID=90970 RepID=UPI001F43D980|nr:hypothetical protein [Alicyclobacillus tolerans]MCF8563742.1 hypothetical protein [Alicyclobacillus tolerans]
MSSSATIVPFPKRRYDEAAIHQLLDSYCGIYIDQVDGELTVQFVDDQILKRLPEAYRPTFVTCYQHFVEVLTQRTRLLELLDLRFKGLELTWGTLDHIADFIREKIDQFEMDAGCSYVEFFTRLLMQHLEETTPQ